MLRFHHNQTAPRGTLIQRGGGTGPTKPRQPERSYNLPYKVPIPSENANLEDKRAAIDDCPLMYR
jgi:hypothetical protein